MLATPTQTTREKAILGSPTSRISPDKRTHTCVHFDLGTRGSNFVRAPTFDKDGYMIARRACKIALLIFVFEMYKKPQTKIPI